MHIPILLNTMFSLSGHHCHEPSKCPGNMGHRPPEALNPLNLIPSVAKATFLEVIFFHSKRCFGQENFPKLRDLDDFPLGMSSTTLGSSGGRLAPLAGDADAGADLGRRGSRGTELL